MYLRRPQGRWASLLFPFTGGNRHIVLQLMSWVSLKHSNKVVGLSSLCTAAMAGANSRQLQEDLQDATAAVCASFSLHAGHPRPCLQAQHTFLCVLLALQTLWGFSLLTFLPVLLALMPGSYSMSKDLPMIPHTHVDMVSGAAAAVSFIGELLMIKASCRLLQLLKQMICSAGASLQAAAADSTVQGRVLCTAASHACTGAVQSSYGFSSSSNTHSRAFAGDFSSKQLIRCVCGWLLCLLAAGHPCV
jgi:hypothetical protein